jgi:hypothetical protein
MEGDISVTVVGGEKEVDLHIVYDFRSARNPVPEGWLK